ncbi:MAG: baseplate J/gp47 family protein [Chloroflexi bacterium]|nr:baseplate J/gp47 family protein [Chloroflexota bacterium]
MDAIIELDEHDDIHTVRDRLATANSPRVILVVPWDAPVLRQTVDVHIVRRFAEVQHIEVAIVSPEGEVRTTVREAGLPVFRSVEAAQRKTRWHKLPDEDDEEEKPWQPSARKTREAHRAAVERDQSDVHAQARRRHPAWRIFKYALVLIVLAVLAGAALVIIPQAEITLVPSSARLIVTINIIADPEATEIDPFTARVPATQITTIVRQLITVPTTGKRGVPESRAGGTVIFVNQLNTPFTVGKGTAVRTTASSQATRFILTEDVQVPGGIGAQAQGKVEAVELGASGNVPANFINEVEGVAALAVRISNPEPLTGGGEREVAAVASEDRDTAREAITPKLREAAVQQLQAELGPGEFVIAESLSGTILEETFDHEITEQADQLSLLMRVEYTAVKVSSEDANRLVFTAMENQAPENYQLIPEGLSFQRGGAAPVEGSDTLFQFAMQGVGYAAADLV